MKTIEVTQATNSLGQYARELEQEPLVLTEGGHAIAALFPWMMLISNPWL
jgi:hypothetical protein